MKPIKEIMEIQQNMTEFQVEEMFTEIKTIMFSLKFMKLYNEICVIHKEIIPIHRKMTKILMNRIRFTFNLGQGRSFRLI